MSTKAQNELRRKASGFVIYAAVSIILVVALANFAVSPAKAEQTNFGPADNGKVADLKPGTIITVGLPENPSTGYAWCYSIDSKVAQVVEDTFILPENLIPGAGGMRVLKLKIIGSGELNMSYERSWEKQPIDFFFLAFKV